VQTVGIAAARQRDVAPRQAGAPAYLRNAHDYRLTPCTALVEGW
jgi:hypothetical protein